MSELQPYNEEQWNDFPLPDSDVAWEKMELLLDKERKRRVLPLWWRFAGLAVLLVGILATTWLWLRSDDGENEANTATLQQKVAGKKASSAEEDRRKNLETVNVVNNNQPLENTSANKIHPSSTTEHLNDLDKGSSNGITKGNNLPVVSSIKVVRNGQRKTKLTSPQGTEENPLAVVTNNGAEKKPDTGLVKKSFSKEDENGTTLPIDKSDNEKKQVSDTAKKAIAPPVAKDDSATKQRVTKPAFVWSAGIGLQQAIAVNGQQSSPYNYNGKKATLSDRLPSAYVRLQKGKWFAQAEFQYSTPQPISSFAFSEKTRFDAANSSIDVERFSIQKLYYHQLPVSINYHILPNLSIGMGGIYNILAGAVTEQEIQSKNVQTGNETITKNLSPVKGFKDSFLYKTTAGLILQTDYHWKRFSLGLRFMQNLQPFIKYTKPDGNLMDEKTNALQAVLRFRLWSSK